MANGENDQGQGNHHLVVALSALSWTLQDHARAERLLALTGLTVSGLRDRAGDSAVLAAVLMFLEAHEPDLLACAAALDISPAKLVRTRELLEAHA
jgi:hypothetical protein